jgi:hypothetical protein
VDGWMDGWMDGWESRVKDCLQQSKIRYFHFIILALKKLNSRLDKLLLSV